MADQRIKTIIQHKHDNEERWANSEYVPLAGELIVYDADESHTYERLKIGDGSTLVHSLPFVTDNFITNSIVLYGNNAGAKGYYWTSFSDKTFTVVNAEGVVDPDEFTRWAQNGGWVSIVNNKHYDRCAQIVSAEYDETLKVGLITLSEKPFESRVEPDEDEEPAEIFLNYAVINLDYPQYGEVDFGKFAVALGLQTTAIGLASTALGYDTRAEANGALAEGRHSKAIGRGSHSEGYYSESIGAYAHAEGMRTNAIGNDSHSEGEDTTSIGASSHAEGRHTVSEGRGSHAEGYKTQALDSYAHAEGQETIAYVANSHTEGKQTETHGNAAHAEGYQSIANADNSHAEGQGTYTAEDAIGAHAEGIGSGANGKGSHAEGNSEANGNYSHSEGVATVDGYASHGEGSGITAAGYAHAEGQLTEARGVASHAEGYQTRAENNYSHAGGEGTFTSKDAQTVIGTYNAHDPEALFVIGSGTADLTRRNAFTVTQNSGTAQMKLGNTKFSDSSASGLAVQSTEIKVQSGTTGGSVNLTTDHTIIKGPNGLALNTNRTSIVSEDGKVCITAPDDVYVGEFDDSDNFTPQTLHGNLDGTAGNATSLGGVAANDYALKKNVVAKTGDTMTGQLNIEPTIAADKTTPLYQDIVLTSSLKDADGNSVELTDLNGPGIGFHASATAWGSLIYNHAFKFKDGNSNNTFAPVQASKFIGDLSGPLTTTDEAGNEVTITNPTKITMGKDSINLKADNCTVNGKTIATTTDLPEGLKLTVFESLSGKTIADLRTMLETWMGSNTYYKDHSQFAVAKFNAGQFIGLWNEENTTDLLTGGSDYIVRILSPYYNNTYVQLEITSYINGAIYYVARSEGTWGKIRQVAFRDQLPTIPTALKNPNALTFGSKTYDGSAAESITAADLGLSGAMKFLGTTTTAISDEATTKTIVVNGDSVTATAGNVVLYDGKEFVWDGNQWEELGHEGSFKVKQSPIASPSTNGEAVEFIDSISQNENGDITATKKKIPTAGADTVGLVSLAKSMAAAQNNHAQAATGAVAYQAYEVASSKLAKTGGTLSGALNITRTAADKISPIEQDLVINYTLPTDENGNRLPLTDTNAPGIGFHVGSTGWANLVYNHSFKFMNNDFTGFVPVEASKFVGNLEGNATTATTATKDSDGRNLTSLAAVQINIWESED